MTEKDKLKKLKWERITPQNDPKKYSLEFTEDKVLRFWLETTENKNISTEAYVIEGPHSDSTVLEVARKLKSR